MPLKMERRLRREGIKKGLKGSHLERYIYGAMRKSGWKPKRKRSYGE